MNKLVCIATLALAAIASFAQAPVPPKPPAPVAPPAQSQPHFVVLIDAAHGGDDTGGTLNGNQKEKSVTLAFSVRLRSLLAARGIQVVTTREEDKNLAGSDRAELANHVAPQACISLHAAETGSGIHLFTSSLSPATPSSASVRFSAWKTAQSAVITRSLALAGVLNSALTQAGFNVTLGRTTLPGIDSMTCPAVAIELAPQRESGNGASRKITAEPGDAAYQAQIAQTLATALLEWKTAEWKTAQGKTGALLP